METVYVVGATSNLFMTAVLPLLTGYSVIACVRKDTKNVGSVIELEKRGVMIVSEPPEKFDRALWFSTHDDVDTLTKLAAEAPTLAISSAAIMDFYRGLKKEEELNAYQKSKLQLGRIPDIYTLIPGFYIEDIPTPEWASKGLHGDSTKKIFSQNKDAQFDWIKSYSVTPKSHIAKAIIMWLDNPNIIAKNKPIIVCSDAPYSRETLHNIAFNKPIQLEEPIYDKFDHIIHISHEDVVTACKSVK